MRLSNYILYGTTAFIVCLAIGYSIYIAFPKNNDTNVRSVELEKSLERMTSENASLLTDIKALTREKSDANAALVKATEISKRRDDEIAKLNEQLTALSATKKSPTDLLNQKVITDLVGLLKCSVTDIANQTNFALEENVKLRDLLARANQKLIASQQRIDTLSSQMSRLQLVNASQVRDSTQAPLIPPFQLNGQPKRDTNPTADRQKKEAKQVANLGKGKDGEGMSESQDASEKELGNTGVAKKSREETASREAPSKNELALSQERQRLMKMVSELQSKLKNREHLLLEQSALIEDLEKQSTRTETTFRRNLGTESSDKPPQPFREIGTFKSVIR